MRWFLECSTKTNKLVKNYKKRSHWHCCLCPQLFGRTSEFRIHLANRNKGIRDRRSSKIVKGMQTLTCKEGVNRFSDRLI